MGLAAVPVLSPLLLVLGLLATVAHGLLPLGLEAELVVFLLLLGVLLLVSVLFVLLFLAGVAVLLLLVLERLFSLVAS